MNVTRDLMVEPVGSAIDCRYQPDYTSQHEIVSSRSIQQTFRELAPRIA